LETFLVVAGACLLAWRGIVAAEAARDARRRGFKPDEISCWALAAVIDADRYWWGARLDRLAAPEARELLADTARTHNLLNVANVRCPLCEAEIKNVLSVAANGELVVRRQAACAHCDFRVDACRHCAHFIPSTAGAAVRSIGRWSRRAPPIRSRPAAWKRWGMMCCPLPGRSWIR